MTEIDDIVFEPVRTFQSCGNQIQICTTVFKAITITVRTFFPWNIFKEPTYNYIPDLIFADGSSMSEYCKSKNIELSDSFYTEEGFSMPVCKTIEEAIEVITEYKLRSEQLGKPVVADNTITDN